MNLPPAVVITHGPGGLGTVRSLARCGINVTAIAYDQTDPVLWSRYPKKKITVPGTEPEEKDIHILEILRELPNDGAALFFTSDQLVSLISKNEDELGKKFHFKLPSKEMVDALNDKVKETALIESLGFPIPKTVQKLPSEASELAKQLRFPIIFKPYLFTVKAVFNKKVETVDNMQELEQFYDDWKDALHVILAQEVIPGPVSNSWVISGTFDENSELLDCLTRQKLRTVPPQFGISTYSISLVNDDILNLVREMGKALGYVGHAGIELRWDDRDKNFKYIEMNPRIGGEVGFDAACGLPTVWNTYQVSLGKSVSHSGSKQKEGIYFIDVDRDIPSMLKGGFPVSKVISTHITLLFKRTSGLWFRWYDPMPGVIVASRFIRDGFRALRRALQQATH